MAEQSVHDVVIQTRSEGDASLPDASANKTQDPQPSGAVKTSEATTTNNNAERQTDLSSSSNIKGSSQKLSDDGIHGERGAHEQEPKAFSYRAASPSNKSTSQTPNGVSSTPAVLGSQIERSASADLSAASDNETGKPEHAESHSGKEDSDGKGHVRTNSIRKPTSFKAVSVTKNFLAKAIGSTGSASKSSGDRASLSTAGQSGSPGQSVPRPRLVAKTGSGLRDAPPRPNSATTGGSNVIGPDPSQVWNKNRPVQPAPPKQFTDEELKQQYGIHLATRLQADDAGKEAKWADIDDDDDDWAPDIIEWNDGTKITLSQQPEPPAAADLRDTADSVTSDNVHGADRPSSDLQEGMQVAEGLNEIKSIQTPIMQLKAGGLKLKGAPEKPVLVAKPPTPMPAKSPWAPLPPVDKVPPTLISPAQQQAPMSRFGQKDPHGFDAMPPMSPSAQQIAADDFSRSWRDGNNAGGTNRELFNSRSGRYEPVIEGRRGSLRSEQHFRQPSVLQRPTVGDAKGAAEPSAAFQSRSAGMDDTWARRRTSSNVSGGSGNFGRRMSINKGPEMLPGADTHLTQRRGSRQESVPEVSELGQLQSPTLSQKSLTHPTAGHSPLQMSQSKAWQARPTTAAPPVSSLSPSTAAAQPQGQEQAPPSSLSPPSTREGEIAMQKRIMDQAREDAKKRKEEEQAREEAAKRERIRLKIEALKAQEGNPNRPTETALSNNEVAMSNVTDGAVGDTAHTDFVQADPRTLPKDQPNESSRFSNSKAVLPRTIKKHIEDAHRSSQLSQVAVESKRLDRATTSAADHSRAQDMASPLTNGIAVGASPEPSLAQRVNKDVTHLPMSGQREAQPWKNVPAGPDTYTSWGASGMTTHTTPGGNLWGSPSNDRGLGNGTFDRGYERIVPRQEPQQQQTNPVTPGPIGPPQGNSRAPKSFVVSPEGRHQPGQTMSPARPNMSPPQSHGVGHSEQTNRPLRTQGRAEGPPSSNTARPVGRLPTGSTLTDEQRAKAVSAWKQLPAQLERDEAEARAKVANEQAILVAEEARTGIKRETYVPVFKETWRQVAVGATDDSRRVVSSATVTAGGKASKTEGDARIGDAQPTAVATQPAVMSMPAAVMGNTRASRFFPHSPNMTSSGAPMSNAYADPVDMEYRSSPPPDSFEHPVYDGDAGRPLVLLPPTKPVVKLPPPVATHTRPPPGAGASKDENPPRQHGPRKNSTSSTSWQDRINGLFGNRKQNSPPKVQALVVSSASKAPLEADTSPASATVSLPRSEDGAQTPLSVSYEAEEAMTKMTEEALVEEREFGSLPRVKLPNQAPTNAWQPARAPSSDRARYQRPLEPFSVLPYLPSILFARQNAQGTAMTVKLPGVETSKTVVLMRPNSSVRQHRTPSHQNSFKGTRRRNKSREGSGSYGMQRGHNGGRASIMAAVWGQPAVAAGAH